MLSRIATFVALNSFFLSLWEHILLHVDVKCAIFVQSNGTQTSDKRIMRHLKFD